MAGGWGEAVEREGVPFVYVFCSQSLVSIPSCPNMGLEIVVGVVEHTLPRHLQGLVLDPNEVVKYRSGRVRFS